jgi:hypothetical protein
MIRRCARPAPRAWHVRTRWHAGTGCGVYGDARPLDPRVGSRRGHAAARLDVPVLHFAGMSIGAVASLERGGQRHHMMEPAAVPERVLQELRVTAGDHQSGRDLLARVVVRGQDGELWCRQAPV